jgi:intracellular sulfur oxidation DsrE/DsrF family protein
MERPTKEQVDAALVMVDNHVRAFPNSKMSLVTLSAEVAALQAENEQLREDKLKRDDLVEQVRSMQAEKAHLMRQLTAARLMLQETTHERVDPNRDPFGGMGT